MINLDDKGDVIGMRRVPKGNKKEENSTIEENLEPEESNEIPSEESMNPSLLASIFPSRGNGRKPITNPLDFLAKNISNKPDLPSETNQNSGKMEEEEDKIKETSASVSNKGENKIQRRFS